MIRKKWMAGASRSGLIAIGALLILLALAFFGAPGVMQAADTGIDSVPPGTVPPGTIPPFLKVHITVVHAAPFDADVTQTAVDICTDDGDIVAGLSNLTFGEARTLELDPGFFHWQVAVAGSNCANVLVDIPQFGLGYSSLKLLVFAGDGVNQPLQVIDVLQHSGGAVLYLPNISLHTS